MLVAGPQKILDINFFQFFEKQTPKLAFWDLANIERNKVRKFGQHSSDHATAADGFMVGGAIMPPPPDRIGLIANHFRFL